MIDRAGEVSCEVYVDYENLGYERALALLWQIRIEEGPFICKIYSHRPVNKLQNISSLFAIELEIYKHTDGTPNASDHRLQSHIQERMITHPSNRFYILSGDRGFRSLTTRRVSASVSITLVCPRSAAPAKSDIRTLARSIECLHLHLRCKQGIHITQLGRELHRIHDFDYRLLGVRSLTALLRKLSNLVHVVGPNVIRKVGVHL